MVEICVVEGDLAERHCDILLLKHANGFHGADSKIAEAVHFHSSVPKDHHVFVPGKDLLAEKIMFVGVGSLAEFRYEKIRAFAANALATIAQEQLSPRSISTSIHGPGYGLDEHEALLSLVSGFSDALDSGQYPKSLERIEIVEKVPARAKRLKTALDNFWSPRSKAAASTDDGIDNHKGSFGARSEGKRKVFVALPFADGFSDIWEIAIQDACAASGLLVERLDAEFFTGDIFVEIKTRLETCRGVIAVLDGANPNVFLELGYAMALKKPSILVANVVENLPFDVKGQRCLKYKNITTLRKLLTDELRELQAHGRL